MSDFLLEKLEGADLHRHPLVSKWKAIRAGEFESAGAPLNNHTLALANSLVVKSGAGLLFGISGFNNKNAAQFIQIFDAQSVPADGAIPDVILTVPTVANFSMDWIFPGRFFQQGIVIVNSSTAATKTIGSADCWIDAQYL